MIAGALPPHPHMHHACCSEALRAMEAMFTLLLRSSAAQQ